MNKINHRNIQRSVLRWLIMGTMFLFLSNDMSATHIVGGDFTYTRLDDGTFEIKLTVRRIVLMGKKILILLRMFTSIMKMGHRWIIHLTIGRMVE